MDSDEQHKQRPDAASREGASPSRKTLSGVIWEFASPWMGPEGPATLQEAKIGLNLASMVWNAVIVERCFDDGGGLRELREHACTMPPAQAAQMLDYIDHYRQRKLALFEADHRLVLKQDVTETEGDFHIQVESKDADEGRVEHPEED